jgi:hypothetical protein
VVDSNHKGRKPGGFGGGFADLSVARPGYDGHTERYAMLKDGSRRHMQGRVSSINVML